jgi:cell division protein FtsL
MRPRTLILLAIVAAVVVSATAVVYSKHRTRTLFAQLQSLHDDRDRLNVEWERLQLEQGAWTTHGRIERLAREELDMSPPGRDDVVLVRGLDRPGLDLGWPSDLAPEGDGTHAR